MRDGLGPSSDKFHIVNFAKDSGEHTSVDETTAQAVFVAPCACEIVDVGLAVTTPVAAHADNHWTIKVVNQTDDAELLSDEFDTNSDNSGNGGRALSEDGLTDLCVNSSGTSYLQNQILAKGDILVLTATKAASATALANPVVVVKFR